MADKKDSVYFAPAGSPVVPGVFDKRIRLKASMRGLFTRDELQKHLDSLPDDTANAVVQNYTDVVGSDDNH